MSFRTGPPPPADSALTLEIENVAKYVASNGPQSGEALKQEKYGDPRYAFLFSGEGSTYYQFRLAKEIDNLRKIAHNLPVDTSVTTAGGGAAAPTGPANPSAPANAESTLLETQIAQLKEQIAQSERNLKAHEDSMDAQKKYLVDKKFCSTEDSRIKELLKNVNIDVDTFVGLVDLLTGSGSKDTISKIKHWIYDNCDTDQKREIILTYFLHRCRTPDATDSFRLHLLYLINDWAYYVQRKKQDNVRQMLSRYVPKLYAHAYQSPAISEKLEKLVGIWEGSRYFDDGSYKNLKNPAFALNLEQATLHGLKQHLVEEVSNELKTNYDNYKKQHEEYARHIQTQIAQLQQKLFAESHKTVPPPTLRSPQKIPSLAAKVDNDLKPKLEYYELPAGMIVKLIKPEDVTKKPVKPEDLRLPARGEVSQNLMAEIDRFYMVTRAPAFELYDENGWDTRALADFYDIKSKHKRALIEKLKEEDKTFDDALKNRPKYESSSSSSSSSSSDSSRSPSPTPKRRSLSPEDRIGFSTPSTSFQKPGNSTSFVKPTISLPSFVKPTSSETSFKAPLSTTNKGAVLLQKMGWEGGGLGSDGQGRHEPIDAGGPRDFQDQFRGIGSKPDEFDEYRKQMSQRFKK